MRSVHRGINIPPEYTSVIKEWPIPAPSRPYQRSRGSADTIWQFIADYATISAPLVQYNKQDQHEGIPHLHEDSGAVKSLLDHEAEVDVPTHPGLPPVPR